VQQFILPFNTDVDRDFPAHITFDASGGNVSVNAIVSFIPPANTTSIEGNVVNAYSGVALAVVVNGNASVVIVTASNTSGLFLAGFQAAGDTNANYIITINGVEKFRFFTNIVRPEVDYIVPGKLNINAGDLIKLIVYNTGDVTADYNGTLIGQL